ncbi:uncharacterized protein B0H18DRAFT_993886 [Fomitopsis serialis]|uniref:uncharacterized protein n=1 Tax=Fomitopsis serialis TaxID=139415 RepID=UPI0020082AE0|nr:uncharacterized protein B0H18DRAFT_993886 [Neoantrodia serialis]KAH9930229.1 hypothetical protein B0H18DRAFT_993886 [Neoantrodia serialis]
MGRLYSEALPRLQNLFPVNHQFKWQYWSPPVDMVESTNGPARLMRLINVARSMKTPELTAMLPLLFYLGAQLSVDELLDGAPRVDGTIERLQPHDARICINGRASLVSANSFATRCFRPRTQSLIPGCSTQYECYTALATMVSDALKEDFFASSDPLRDLTVWFEKRNLRWHLCKPCAEHILKNHRDARTAIWVGLPTILCLDNEPNSGV